MIRMLSVSVACCLVLSGCGDAHHPVVRESQPEPAGDGSSPASPHGMPASAEADPPAEELGRNVELGQMRLTAPEGWTRKRPKIGFILAEFSIPHAADDSEDARLTVSAAGGSIEENVQRWRQQYGGNPEEESQEKIEVSDITITTVDFSGTYQEHGMGPAAAQQRPGYRMLGAIIPIAGQLYFVKCYGPQQTVADHADEFQAFICSLASNDSS